jgi:drug/metabolite transporter (DMT)-like permease
MAADVLALVLLAAAIHASWNTWLKLAGDRLVLMALMGAGWALFAACWVPFLPLPSAAAWPYLAISVAIHLSYTLVLVPAYRLIDLSVAYPMIRGTAPVLVTVISAAGLGEPVGTVGALAVLLVTAGVMTLGWSGSRGRYRALLFGLGGGGLVAAYTLVDGLGSRLSGSIHAYAAWLFLLSGLPLLFVGLIVRRGAFVGLARPIAVRGMLAGVVASIAFWLVIWALSQAPMGLVAAARETSVVLVALSSGLLLREKVNWVAIAAVFAGVVLIRLAGS